MAHLCAPPVSSVEGGASTKEKLALGAQSSFRASLLHIGKSPTIVLED